MVGTFSRKFNKAQLKYPVGEQELLAAHEAAQYFSPLIRGCELLIKSDHKNLSAPTTKHTNLRVLRQRITLDQEFQATFDHLPGEDNTGADRLSPLEMYDEVPKAAKEEL